MTFMTMWTEQIIVYYEKLVTSTSSVGSPTHVVSMLYFFLSAADRRRRRRCMSGNVRPSVRLSVCLSVRPTSFATFDHFPEVLSMRNRYG